MQTEKRIRKFYARWSPPLLAFCQLLVDQDADAERSVIEAFQTYASHGLDFDLLVLPALLFTVALDSVKKGEIPIQGKSTGTKTLREALVRLPWKERAVFVLRSVLGLEEELVGEIVEIPMQEVRRIWMKALLKLREVLPREFFPRSAQ
jgi:hypothetical protein